MHAEKKLGSLNAIRTAYAANLDLIGHKDYLVPDLIKLSMPACSGLLENAAALKSHMSSDGIHSSDFGYQCLATGLSNHLQSIPLRKPKNIFPGPLNVSGVKRTGKQSFYWRGFVKPVGTGRPANHKAAYLQSHSNPAAGRGLAGGGKWRNSNQSIHSRTPYGGGKRGK
jgi:hypothetical protein